MDPGLTSLQFAEPEVAAMQYEKRGLAVYDGEKMMMGQGGYQDFVFKPGVNPKDAVVGVYFLQYEQS